MQLCYNENEKICAIAAGEFISLWKQCTGETPVKCGNPAESGEDLAVLGSEAVNPFVFDKLLDDTIRPFRIRFGSDDYQITVCKDKAAPRNLIFLAGGRPRALLYAVYRFFELRAGCRYFWDGDRIPAGETIDLSPVEIAESPRFQYRGLRYFAHRGLKRFQAEHWTLEDWKHEIDWILKRRLNLFMLRIGQDDLFQKAFPEIVGYPKEWTGPDDVPDSYNDRTLFWSLEERGKLRKALLQYAFDRDLLHPEDCGTMSHWYSPTPAEFLDKVKPEYLPQCTDTHSARNLQVFDVRKDKFLEYYFQLTRAHVEHYGSPAIFHTIGLAERKCYREPEKNYKFKLYAYHRLISRLRKDYPDAPLLVSSWEFCVWSIEEIQTLLGHLDPENTLIFEYTAESVLENHSFTRWGIVGKFPWIFGIFHAFLRESDIRGNYDVIEEKLKIAADDTFCKGMVLWPEVSHSDTLMLDFFSHCAWDPSDASLDGALRRFCADRYGRDAGTFEAVWRKLMVSACWIGFHHDTYTYNAADLLCENAYRDVYVECNEENRKTLEIYQCQVRKSGTLLAETLCGIRELLALCTDEFRKRDILDMGRTAILRFYLAVLGEIALRRYEAEPVPEELLKAGEETLILLSKLTGASPEYSLYDSLEELKKHPGSNPDFERHLKSNIADPYCRCFFMTEQLKGLLLPEYRYYADSVRRGIRAKTEELSGAGVRLLEEFNRTPLAVLREDHDLCRKALPKTLEQSAALAKEILETFILR